MGSGSGPIGYGAEDRPSGSRTTPRPPARAERGLRRLLPGLAGAKVVASWGGPIDVSADHLPFIGTVPGTHLHYALGYSGHGVGPTWLAGQALASRVAGLDDEWTRLPLVDRQVARVPPEPFRRVGGGAIRASILACEEAEEDGLDRPAARARGRLRPSRLGPSSRPALVRLRTDRAGPLTKRAAILYKPCVAPPSALDRGPVTRPRSLDDRRPGHHRGAAGERA